MNQRVSESAKKRKGQTMNVGQFLMLLVFGASAVIGMDQICKGVHALGRIGAAKERLAAAAEQELIELQVLAAALSEISRSIDEAAVPVILAGKPVRKNGNVGLVN